MKLSEKKINLRDQLLFGENYDSYSYEFRNGKRYFDCLRRHEFRVLVEKKMILIYPYTKYVEMWWFMEKFGNDNKMYLQGISYYLERGGNVFLTAIGRDEAFEDKKAMKVFKFLFF